MGPRAGRAAPQPLLLTLRASLNLARCDSESAALGPRCRWHRKRRGSRLEIEIGVGPAGGGGEVHPSRQPGRSSLQSRLCLVTALGAQGCVLGSDNSFGKEVCTSNPAEIGVQTPWGWRRGTRGLRTVGASHTDLPNPGGGQTEGELCGPSPEGQDQRQVGGVTV